MSRWCIYAVVLTATSWKKSCFILSARLDFYMIDNMSKVVRAFAWRMMTSFVVDEILFRQMYMREVGDNLRSSLQIISICLNKSELPCHPHCFFILKWNLRGFFFFESSVRVGKSTDFSAFALNQNRHEVTYGREGQARIENNACQSQKLRGSFGIPPPGAQNS